MHRGSVQSSLDSVDLAGPQHFGPLGDGTAGDSAGNCSRFDRSTEERNSVTFVHSNNLSMLRLKDKPANQLSWLNKLMGLDLKDRLEAVMEQMDWKYADLLRVSGQSSSVVSQWLGRGSKLIKTIGKMEAAEKIEQASGFAALWIAKGVGPRMAAGADQRVGEPTLQRTLMDLVGQAEGADQYTRQMLAVALQRLVLEPESYEFVIEQITALMNAGKSGSKPNLSQAA